MQVTFPHQLLVQTSSPRLIGQALDRMESISGAETLVPTLSGRWSVVGTFLLRGAAAHLAYDAFLAQMEGRIGTTLVPFQARYHPFDRDGHAVPQCVVADLGDAQTWEHFGFENAPVAMMRLDAAAPLRAVRITVTLGNTTGIRPGQMFSIDERAYQAQYVWAGVDGRIEIQFQPPLRVAVGAGRPIVLDRVACKMRLVGEDLGSVDRAGPKMQSVSLAFEEAL